MIIHLNVLASEMDFFATIVPGLSNDRGMMCNKHDEFGGRAKLAKHLYASIQIGFFRGEKSTETKPA